ncbi:MAG: hypothetical protein ACI92G_004453, partial [Candidatus Pelagisphaera sp.]
MLNTQFIKQFTLEESTFFRTILLSACTLFAYHLIAQQPQAAKSKNSLLQPESSPNILIIGIDDLRPELNCYGAEHIHSPNIDRLASR